LKNELEHWIQFFLAALAETASSSIATFKSINRLREEIEYRKILQLGKRTAMARALLHILYRTGYTNAQLVQSDLHVSSATAHSLIADFVRLGILEEITGFKRNRMFAFSEYLDLFRD
jgi:Fic family protein